MAVIGAASVGILYASGMNLQDVLARWPEAQSLLRSVWEDTSQLAAETGTRLYNRLADYQEPRGEGLPLEGDLPENRLPDAATYDFPEVLYPYRAMLSGAEQSAYDQAYANAMELYEQFPLNTPLSTDSVERVMNALFCDHPELFWLESSYRYSYISPDSVVAVALSFNETATNIETYKTHFETAAQQVIQTARGLDSAVEREKYVHDYLVDNVSYSLDSALNQSAYSALVYGESVCAGYARAFQYLMQQLEIPCYYCTGYAGEAHAWNIIRLDEEYYHVDVAWNDPLGNDSGRRYYSYFNLTDTEISGDHTRGELSALLPKCTGTAYSYANVFGTADGGSAAGDSGMETRPADAQAIRSPEDAGFSRPDAITSIDEYYAFCEEKLVELGEGTHAFSMLLMDTELMESIYRLTEDKTAMESWLTGAAQRLGYDAYSAGVSLQGETLADGYWLLTQQVRFTGQQPQETRTPSGQAPQPDTHMTNDPAEMRPEESAPGGRGQRGERR